MSNIEKLRPVEAGENFCFEPDYLLEAAKSPRFTNLVILGEPPNGELWFSGMANADETMILLERAKHHILFGED
jgi:hypothetical protein